MNSEKLFLRVSVEGSTVSNVIEKSVEQGIHCLSSSNTNDVIDLLPKQLRVHIDVKLASSSCQSAKALGTTVCNSIYIDIWHHLTYKSRGA